MFVDSPRPTNELAVFRRNILRVKNGNCEVMLSNTDI